MEPTFIYYNNLTLHDKKKFSINFSDEEWLGDVLFQKNKDYSITCMACYLHLAVDITKLPITQKSNKLLN